MPFNNPSPTTLIAAQPVSASILKSNIGSFSSQTPEYVFPPLVIDQGNTYLDRETAGSAFVKTSNEKINSRAGKSRSDTFYGMSTTSPEILMRFTTDDLSSEEFDEYAKCIDLEIKLDAAQSGQFFSAAESNSPTSYQERTTIVETLAEDARNAIFSMSDALDSIDEMSKSVTIGNAAFTEGSQTKYSQNLETISDSIVSNVSVRNPSLAFDAEKSKRLFEFITSLQETKSAQYQRILTGSVSVDSFVKGDKSYLDTTNSIDRTFSTLSQILRKTIGESQVSNTLIQSSSATIKNQFNEIGSFPFDGSLTDEKRTAKTLGFDILDKEDYTSLDKVIDVLSKSESFTDNLIINSALNVDNERYTPVGLFLRIVQATVNSNSSIADANTTLTIDNPGQIWDSYLTTIALQGGQYTDRYLQLITDSLINSIDGTSSSSDATTTIADTLIEDDSADPSTRRIKSTTVVQNSTATSIDDIIASSDDTNIIAKLFSAYMLLPPTQQVFYAQTVKSKFESSSYTVDEPDGGKKESEFPRIGATEYFESFKTFQYSGMYYSSGENANDEIYTRLKKYGSIDSGTVTTEIKNFYNEILKDISSITGLDTSVIEKNGFAGVTRKNLVSLIVLCFAHAIAVTLRPKFLKIEDFGSSVTGEGQSLYVLSFPRGATNLIRSIRDSLKTSGTIDEITQSVYLTYSSDVNYGSTRWVSDSFLVITRYIKVREERYDTFVKNILWSKSITQYLGEVLVNFKERISNNMAQLKSAATSAGVSFPIKYIRRNSVAARSFSLEHDFLLSSTQSLQRMMSEFHVAKSYIRATLNEGIPVDIISVGLPVGFSETLVTTIAKFAINKVRLDGLIQSSVENSTEIIDTSIFVAFDGVESDTNFLDILNGTGVIFHYYNGNDFVDSTFQGMIDSGYDQSLLRLIIASASRGAAIKLLSSVSLGQAIFDEIPFVSSKGASFFVDITGGPASTYFPNSGLEINQITIPYLDGWKVTPFSSISGTGTSLIDESSLRMCMRILNDPLFTAETISRSIVGGPSIERIHNLLIPQRDGYVALSANVSSLSGNLPKNQPVKEAKETDNQQLITFSVDTKSTSKKSDISKTL